MEPIIDHIQLTVRDLAVSEAFYDKLLLLLGYDLAKKNKGRVEAHDFDVVEYVHPKLVLGINSPRASERDTPVHRRRPGSLHHLAFRASSPEAIDALYPHVQATGAQIVAPPQYWPQHGERYYALFFKDPDGMKLELM
ncbi:MAG: VOC family protein, partial [Flavobacteriales bacterium]|nr:VOC family protein [Flavobacteriales bacterium]